MKHWRDTVIGNWKGGILGEMGDAVEHENASFANENGVTSREVSEAQHEKEKTKLAMDAKKRKRLFDRLMDLLTSRTNKLRARDTRHSARDARCYAQDCGGLTLEAFYAAEMTRRTERSRIVKGGAR